MTRTQRDRLRRDMYRLLDRGARPDRDGGDTLDDKLLKLHAAALSRGRPKAAPARTTASNAVAARAKTPPPPAHNSWPAGYRVWPPPGQRAYIDPVTYRD